MSARTVTTQAELDKALRDKVDEIEIRSPRGVWLEISDSDSASVRAFGLASVSASGSASVRAFGSASVRATKAVAVHLHSARATVEGGVVIDVSKPLTDPAEWCDHHGVEVSKAGVATLYKAVNGAWVSGYGTAYEPGSKPTAPDWREDNDCGGGLHFCPSPTQARTYNWSATRFLAVGVKVSELRPIPGGGAKCKAPRVVRACVEVDEHARPVPKAVTQ